MRKCYLYVLTAVLSAAQVMFPDPAQAQFALREMASGPQITSDGGAIGIASGDIDQDGKPDLAISFHSAGLVQIFRNVTKAAEAAFAPAVTLPYGDGSSFNICLRDINKDAKPDLLIANYKGQSLTILINRSTPGNIAFDAPQHFPCPASAYALITGDLNMDGKPEIIVSSENLLSIFSNTATAPNDVQMTLSATITLASPVHDLKVADMNGDGNIDIVAGTADGISILPNQTQMRAQTYAFASTVETNFDRNIHAIDIGDLNGDFMPEVVTANYPAAEISVLQNTSSGNAITLASPQHIITAASFDVAITDMDGDGMFDVASMADGHGWDLAALFRNTTGADGIITFAEAQPITPVSDNLITGDFDGNGLEDIASVNDASNMFSVWVNQPKTTPAAISDAIVYCNEDGLTGIDWHVSGEVPGTRYIIERTTDGRHFEPVHNITGSAVRGIQDYSVSINREEWQTVFYRIITQDAAGNKELSSLLSLTPCKSIVTDFVCVFPNPVEHVMNFSFSVTSDLDMHFEIVDLNMRSRLGKTEHITAGTRTYSLQVSELPTGSYIFSVRFGNLPPYVCRFEKL